MRYLITGATGFIGRALSSKLKEQGHTVIPCNRNYLDTWRTFKHFVEYSDTDEIIHLAAYGNHYTQTDFNKTIQANVYGSLNVFMGSMGKPVYNFLSSSIGLEHRTTYSITKEVSKVASDLFDNVTNIIPYSIYGPGEARFRFIPTVIKALHSGDIISLDEVSVHDWVYLDDFINSFLELKNTGKCIEIGSGVQTSNLEVVLMLEKISGLRLKYGPGKLRAYDTPKWVCENPVACRTLEEGLTETYNQWTP